MFRKLYSLCLVVVLILFVIGPANAAISYTPLPRPTPAPAGKPTLSAPYTDPAVVVAAGYGNWSHNDVNKNHTYYALDFKKGSNWDEFDVKAAAPGKLTYATWKINLSTVTADRPTPSYCATDPDPEFPPEAKRYLMRTALIDHGNGWYTVYGHLASFSVPDGKEVKAGDTIGKAGCSGTWWRHLHFELRHWDSTNDTWGYETTFVTLPSTPAIDIAFLIDTTGSMGDDITRVKADATRLINKAFDLNPNTRIAVVDFRDYPQRTAWYDYPYNDVQEFTDNRGDAIAAIEGLQLGWGGDWQETDNCALMHVIENSNCAGYGANTSIGPWIAGTKSIILMTDAPALNPEPFTNFTVSYVKERSKAGNFMLIGGFDDNSFDEPYPPFEPIAIYPVIIGGDPTALEYGEVLAEGTGGKVFSATSADDVVDALLEAITAAATPPEPAPTCESAYADPGMLWPPNQMLVPVSIEGVDNADTVAITNVWQDEPTGLQPDAVLDGSNVVQLRAFRLGKGNGRVYHVNFNATGPGGTCTGTVKVIVPHDMGIGQHERGTAEDGGPLYQSTMP